MWIIAKLSYKELFHKRIFLIAVLMSLAFLLFFGIAIHYSAKSYDTSAIGGTGPAGNFLLIRSTVSIQMLSIGLFMGGFITALLSILGSVGSVSGEIESHQIDTLLARPLPRSQVILGKWIGLGWLMIVYALLLFVGILGIMHWVGSAFVLVMDPVSVVKAAIVFALIPLLFIALGLYFSSFMTTINAGIVLIVLYGISFVGGFVEQIGAVLNSHAMINIGILSSLLFPADSLSRFSNVLLFNADDSPLDWVTNGPFSSINEPSPLMIGYAIVYGLCFLWLAVRKFGKRDL